MSSAELAAMRQNYALAALSESDVLADPFAQFSAWFAEAVASQLPEPNAMTLATASPDGQPTARTVLLKGVENQGFVFFTNYESQKADDLAANPRAALLFTWLELQRQIRIEGRVEKIARAASEAYFQSRPRESQIGAWASPQSRIVASRETLETRMAALEKEYAGLSVLPCPPHWGGYCLRPERIEFWQGRPSRLHDRILFSKTADGSDGWKIERLAP